MPRGRPSAADEQLIVELAQAGHQISPYQLERWRRHGQLPRTERHGRGRGAGSSSTYPPEALATALLLAEEVWQGRSRHLGTLAVFAQAASRPGELWVSEPAVREAIGWAFGRMQRQTAPDGEGKQDAIDAVAARVRQRTSIYDPALIHLAHPANPTRRQRDDRAKARRRLATSRAMGVMVMFEDPENIGAEMLADAMDVPGWGYESLRTDLRELEEEGVELFEAGAPSFFSDLTEKAKTLPLDELCNGRDAVLQAGAANEMVGLVGLINEQAIELLAEFRTSDVGQLIASVPYITTPVALAVGSVTWAVVPGLAVGMKEAAAEAMRVVLPRFIETMAIVASKGGPESALSIGPMVVNIAMHHLAGEDSQAWGTPSMAAALNNLHEVARAADPSQVDPLGLLNAYREITGPTAPHQASGADTAPS